MPDLVWHITHRCHERDFLLKFSRDRNSYLRWLYEARKRFGLCVLDYMVTSNHVHPLVKDTAEGVIARSMQLIAGRAAQWPHSGYLEIQQPPERYRVVDLLALIELCGFDDIREFQKAHREWVDAGSSRDTAGRDDRWSESIAVGSEGFVEQVKIALGFRAQHRQVAVADGLYTLREPVPPYGDHFDRENEALRPNNTVPWQTNLETTEA